MRTALRARAGVLGEVWRHQDLRRAQLAWGGFHTAEWASLVALSVVAYDAHGTRAVGLVLFARMAASAALTPFVAVLGDRLPRERILLAAHLLRASGFAGAAVAFSVGGSAYAVYALGVLAALPLAAHRPCHLGLAPLLAQTPAQLTAGNVASMLLESASALVGPGLAALLLAVSDAGSVFLVAAACSLLSALAIARVRPEYSAEPPQIVPRRTGRELGEGVRAVAANPSVRLVFALFGAQTLVRGFLGVFLVVIALDLVGLGRPGVGLLSAAFGVGGVLGAAAAVALVGRAGLGRPFQLSLALWGLPLVVIGAFPEPGVALVALAVSGVGNTVLDVAGFTSMQEHADERVLGRVFGLFELVVILTVGLGSLLAPGAVDLLGDRASLVVVGALLPLLAVLFHGQLGRLDDGLRTRPADLELLLENPIFAPLPYVVLREVAASLQRRLVAAGETIVREGEPGETMYVVAEGRVRVTKEGRPVDELARGEAFGEIALLLDVPRTATVTAASAAELALVSREHFLAAVTRHQVSGDAARTLAGARLRRTEPAAETV